jgi:putative addiction module CopG family antidote
MMTQALNVNLTAELRRCVKEQVRSGRYQNENEVVRDAVRQGELRREATARHSAATWRCTALRSLRQRDDCLAQLNAAAPEVTLLPATARPDVAAMTQDNSTR